MKASNKYSKDIIKADIMNNVAGRGCDLIVMVWLLAPNCQARLVSLSRCSPSPANWAVFWLIKRTDEGGLLTCLSCRGASVLWRVESRMCHWVYKKRQLWALSWLGTWCPNSGTDKQYNFIKTIKPVRGWDWTNFDMTGCGWLAIGGVSD